jgi:CHASE2 domain-containing sensor protein
VWAPLIDGLLAARARRIAFDVVFAYAGADFEVGSFILPDYDRSLIDSLGRARDRIVLGRFPSIPPAPPFLGAVGASRVGVLDLQLESDGRVRSTAPLIRLADGRIALGFAALAAGLSVRQASAAQRILIAPYAPMTDTPTYSLGTLLDCLSSECQSASKFDPRSASNFDPLERRVLAIALTPSELVGVAETARARVVG